MSEDGDIDIDVESAEDVPDIGVEATATTIDDGMDYSVSHVHLVCVCVCVCVRVLSKRTCMHT